MSPKMLRAALAGGLLLACGARSEAAFNSVTPTGTGSGGYWDHGSHDTIGGSSQLNVGYYLTGTGGFSTPQVSSLQFDAAAGAAGFSIGTGVGGFPANTVTLNIEVAGNHGSNQLWVKDGTGSFKQVFGGGASSGATNITISGTDPFTLILVDGLNHRAYDSMGNAYSLDGSNNLASATFVGKKQNFAMFRDGTAMNQLWFGIEDLLQGDNDYNDMIVKFSRSDNNDFDVISTPAPPAFALAAMGILPCLALRKRLSAKKA